MGKDLVARAHKAREVLERAAAPKTVTLVHFIGEDETVFPPGDALKAIAVLKHYIGQYAGDDPCAQLGLPGTVRKLLRLVPKLTLEHDGSLRLRMSDWNDYLTALIAEGIALHGQPLEE